MEPRSDEHLAKQAEEFGGLCGIWDFYQVNNCSAMAEMGQIEYNVSWKAIRWNVKGQKKLIEKDLETTWTKPAMSEFLKIE